MVFNSLDRHRWATASYDVGVRVGEWLDSSPSYQVRDLVGLDPERPLWRRPFTGAELRRDGISVGLQPYQVQALKLVRLDADAGAAVSAG